MPLACDTDYLTKVEHWELAEEILKGFGTTREESYCLKAAVHMLRKKKAFRLRFGDDVERIASMVERYKTFEDDAPSDWVDRMAPHSNIDRGEADLLARIADGELLIMATGDKRCLRCIKQVEGLTEAIARRVVTLDGMLLHLCELRGVEFVRRLIGEKARVDTTIGLIFSSSASDASVLEGLRSYHYSLLEETGLTLWAP